MSGTRKENILVVISEPQTNYLLERILRSAGYNVLGTTSAATAREAVAKDKPELIIVADKLTDGDGHVLVLDLLKTFPALPVLMFVPKESPEILRQALKIGASDVLFPPLHSEDILSAVEASLSLASRRKDWAVLESKRVTSSLQRRVDELETLARLGRTITATLDLDGVLSVIVDAAVELTNAEEGSLLLLDEETGELYMRAARNFQEDFVRTFRLPVTDSLAGNVIRTGQPILLDEKTPQKIKTAYLVSGLLYVPLQIHGHVFGVLGVDNRQSRMPFTDRQVKIISAMADYAVIAIENARLYAHTEQERNKMETILTKIEDGVIVLDLEGRLVLVNQTVRAAFNLGDEPLTGKLAVDVFQQPGLVELLNVRDGKPITGHAELSLDDGRYYSAQVTPIAEVGLAITMHDITYLKKLDHIKSDFVSTVSHDLRSPLTAILGYVELIDRAGPINDLQREFISRVQISVQNITSLVDDLLNLGRIEAGFDSRNEMIQLEQIIEYSLDGFKKRIADKDIQIARDISANVPLIFGDPVQVKQMVDNLLENAIKYSMERGTVKILLHIEGKQIILQVGDSGIGIPPLDIPYIFDKFYRASNVSMDVAGTGLGLAIVKSIVENHQGRIWVESIVGQGTTFTVVLPVPER